MTALNVGNPDCTLHSSNSGGGEQGQAACRQSVDSLETLTESNACCSKRPASSTLPLIDQTAMAEAVMLVLVGVQGSGKSTFSQKLVEAAAGRTWVRINQDSINKGKRGTREMCLASARSALAAGSSAIIDRTNIDAGQRQAFIGLAQDCGVQAHCLVLRLPVKTCMGRAAGRENHEGGLMGKKVYAAVNIMHNAFMKAGPPDLGEGFRSVLVCENDAEVEAALQAWSTFGVSHCDPTEAWRKLAPPQRTPLAAGAAPVRGRKGVQGVGGVKPGGKGSIESFFKKLPSSKQVHQEGGGAAEAGSAEKRLRVMGPAESTKDTHQQQAQQAAPHQLSMAQQAQQGDQARPGAALQPPSAPHPTAEQAQQAQQGYPSLQIQQAQQAQQGYPSQQTQQTQQGATAPCPASSKAGSRGSGEGGALQALMMHARHAGRQQAQQQGGAPTTQRELGAGADGAAGGLAGSRHTFSRFPAVHLLAQVAAEPDKSASDPAFFSDHLCVRISDKYPKARHHALVVARDPRLQGPLDLGGGDIPLVQHMVDVGQQWAAQQRTAGSPHIPPFFFGFHSVPSMRQLHLHVLSQDLDSPSLKVKKHYLSFLPPFFLPAEVVLRELQQAGRLQYSLQERDAVLKGPLKCHRCGAKLPTMPALKQHLAACQEGVWGPRGS